MSDWIQAPLGSLATISIGGTPSRDNPAYWATAAQEGYPWVSIADLGPRFITDTKEQITDRGVNSSNVKLVPKGTLLLSFKLTIGRTGIAARELFTNEAIAAIKPLPGSISPRFLYYVLPEAAKAAVTDTAIKGATLNKQKLGSLDIRFPAEIERQESISDILEAVDSGLEKTASLIAKYQQIKAGLMHDLFTRGVTADGKLRPPREQAPELYQETPIGWIPKEWTLGRLDDEIRIIDCKHYTPTYRAEGYPVVRPRNVKDEGLNFNDIDYVNRKDFLSLIDIHKPQKDDIVFSRNASFGVPCFVEEDIDFAIGQDVVVMTKKLANTRFVYYLLKSTFVAKQISRLSAGSTFGRINLGDIRDLQIPVSSRDEQERISDRLTAIDKKLGGERQTQSKLRELKRGMMHDLLTGEVRVEFDEGLMETTND